VAEPVGTGTRNAYPSNFPCRCGNTNPIAFAAPVLVGTTFNAAARARLEEAITRIERQLRDLTDLQKGKVKVHPEQQTTAFIDKLFPEEGYGFIRSLDGQEIYFHRNSVVNEDFGDLKVGLGVTYDLSDTAEDAQGQHASSVRVIGR